jgi:hypothetical protein
VFNNWASFWLNLERLVGMKHHYSDTLSWLWANTCHYSDTWSWLSQHMSLLRHIILTISQPVYVLILLLDDVRNRKYQYYCLYFDKTWIKPMIYNNQRECAHHYTPGTVFSLCSMLFVCTAKPVWSNTWVFQHPVTSDKNFRPQNIFFVKLTFNLY